MNKKTLPIFLIFVLSNLLSCNPEMNNSNKVTTNQSINDDAEKVAILNVLNDETKAAYTRDYEGWKEKWIHKQYVSKTYMDFSNDSMTETLGWDEINEFVKNYIEEHPEPAPIPSKIKDINVRLYGNGASVIYEQIDAKQGLKRETRIMEKENGQWKIAGMHTSIYGKKEKQK